VTFEKAKDSIEARDLDLIRVKGKKEPRRVFEVLCKKGDMSEALRQGRDKYHAALKLYRDQKFQDAIHIFEEVLHFLPDDHLTRKYLERARVYAITPPAANWDGVFEMKSK
jgi:adenylate cyclase